MVFFSQPDTETETPAPAGSTGSSFMHQRPRITTPPGYISICYCAEVLYHVLTPMLGILGYPRLVEGIIDLCRFPTPLSYVYTISYAWLPFCTQVKRGQINTVCYMGQLSLISLAFQTRRRRCGERCRDQGLVQPLHTPSSCATHTRLNPSELYPRRPNHSPCPCPASPRSSRRDGREALHGPSNACCTIFEANLRGSDLAIERPREMV